MTIKMIKILCFSIIIISIKLLSMENEPLYWDKLPYEIKSYILSFVPQRKSMAEIFEGLTNASRVNKEFRQLVKWLVFDPDSIVSLSKKYIQENEESAYKEFFTVAKIGNKDLLKAFLNAKIDVKAKDQRDRTALMYAINSCDKDIVKMLLIAGAEVNAQDKAGCTPLLLAAIYKNRKIIQVLLNAGADINAKDNNDFTPLMCAATTSKANKEIVKLLLNRGADVDAQDSYGDTALIMSSRNNHKKIVRLLLENGADAYLQNNNGETALRIAENLLIRLVIVLNDRTLEIQKIIKILRKFMKNNQQNN